MIKEIKKVKNLLLHLYDLGGVNDKVHCIDKENCILTTDRKICQHWLTWMKRKSVWLRSTLVRQWWTFSHNGVFHAQTAPNFWLYSTPKLSRQLQMLAKYRLHNSSCVFMTYKTIKRKTDKTVFESDLQCSTFWFPCCQIPPCRWKQEKTGKISAGK